MDKCGEGWVPGGWELEAGGWVPGEAGTEIPVSSVLRQKRLEAWTPGFEEEGGQGSSRFLGMKEKEAREGAWGRRVKGACPLGPQGDR